MAVEDLGADEGETGEIGREAVIDHNAKSGEDDRERWQEGKARGQPPPPLAGGGWWEGVGRYEYSPLPLPPSRKGRGSIGVHSTPCTVMRPAAWRANMPGRYMSETSAPGSS
jgi:hypothetical protein